MSDFYFSSPLLATGQTAPFVGPWVNISKARHAMIVIFGSGISGTFPVNVEAQTQLNGSSIFQSGGSAEGVPFYAFTGVTNGYSNPAFLQTPMSDIRVNIPSGNGQIYGFISIQN